MWNYCNHVAHCILHYDIHRTDGIADVSESTNLVLLSCSRATAQTVDVYVLRHCCSFHSSLTSHGRSNLDSFCPLHNSPIRTFLKDITKISIVATFLFVATHRWNLKQGGGIFTVGLFNIGFILERGIKMKTFLNVICQKHICWWNLSAGSAIATE